MRIPKSEKERKTIHEVLEYDIQFDCIDLECFIDELKSYKKKFPNHTNLVVEKECDYDMSYMHIAGDRLETDSEYNKRIKKYMSDREKQKAKEKEAFARHLQHIQKLAEKQGVVVSVAEKPSEKKVKKV